MKKLLRQDGDIAYYLMSSADSPREFYADLGHIFASTEIRKELDGYAINNDDERLWIVTMEDVAVIGFLSFGLKSNNENQAIFYDAWVHPDRRNNGIYRKLINLSLSKIRKLERSEVLVIANERSLPVLSKCGFTEYRKRGRFTYLRLELPMKAAKA
jgi:GNAT superfamily N-acetyltransferase